MILLCLYVFMLRISQFFDINTGSLIMTVLGHHDLVYDLCWSADGSELVSVSACVLVVVLLSGAQTKCARFVQRDCVAQQLSYKIILTVYPRQCI